MSKAQRQHRISSLLEEHAVTSQTQLTELLEADGIGATQATVSRDLDELGAMSGFRAARPCTRSRNTRSTALPRRITSVG